MSKKIKAVNKLMPISEERYIRERARNLPIVKCLLSKDKFERGLNSSIVVRQMANGNFVIGTYMIDSYCLGIKETFYIQNASEEKLEELMEHFSMAHDELIEVPYVELHNRIYGALIYAEDLGFRPQKDWAISQYILEEDTDEIELIEYEYGKDGKPLYIVGPYDNPDQIINTLKKSVGEGNFEVVYSEDEMDGFFGEEILSLDADELMEEAEIIGFSEEQQKWFNHKLSYLQMAAEASEEISEEDAHLIDEIYDEITRLPVTLRQIVTIQQLVKKYPNTPKLYNFMYNAYLINKENKKADEWLQLILSKFPNYFYGRIMLANQYLHELEPEKMLQEAFKGAKSLVELYPEQDTFHALEFANFYFVMVRYYLQEANEELALKIVELLEEVVPDENSTAAAREAYDKEVIGGNMQLLALMKKMMNYPQKRGRKKKNDKN